MKEILSLIRHLFTYRNQFSDMDQVWDEKLFSGSTIKTLKRLKFTKMTPVQAAAIPLFLQRKDFAAEAVTEVELAKEFLIQKNHLF